MYNQSFDIKAMSLLSLGLKTILVSANAHGSYFDRTIIQKNLNSDGLNGVIDNTEVLKIQSMAKPHGLLPVLKSEGS